MSRILVHFGMHKTGSSSIQETLFKALPTDSFHYLHFGMPNSSQSLKVAFNREYSYRLKRERGFAMDKIVHMKKIVRRQFARNIKVNEAKSLIVSAEGISHFTTQDLLDLQVFLSRFKKDVEAVGYVRRPKSYLESAYQQILKVHFSPFSKFSSKIDYKARLKPIADAFGKDHVKYWLFDKAMLSSGDVVVDFLERNQIEIDRSHVTRVNESLSMEAVKLLYIYRSHFKTKQIGDDAVVDLLSRLSGPAFRLHSKLFANMHRSKEYLVSNRWLNEQAGIDLAEDLTADDGNAISNEEQMTSIKRETLDELASLLPAAIVSQVDLKTDNVTVANVLRTYALLASAKT